MKPTLSPATRVGLFTTLLQHGEAQSSDIETRTVHLCPECDEPHDSRWDAVECCEQSIETATYYACPACDKAHPHRDEAAACCGCAGAVAPQRCPVCDREAGDYEDAADCCLWKDLGAPDRWRIAAAVEGGSSWADAIAAATGAR